MARPVCEPTNRGSRFRLRLIAVELIPGSTFQPVEATAPKVVRLMKPMSVVKDSEITNGFILAFPHALQVSLQYPMICRRT